MSILSSDLPPETIPNVDKNGDKTAELIHRRAIAASARYRMAEAELIEILQEAEGRQVFMQRGHSNLYQYVIAELGLAENVAYNLITVARKAREVPELHEMLRARAITLSNARRVAAVLTPENKDEWLPKAATLSHRKLEREIARVRPQAATPERATYTSENHVRLELGLSEREMLRLRRAQDLLCQAKRRPVTLAETIEVLTKEFLFRNDPLEKAKRFQVRRGGATCVENVAENPTDNAVENLTENPAENPAKDTTEHRNATENGNIENPSNDLEKLVTLRVSKAHGAPRRREALSAETRHRVNLRDGGRCTFRFQNGTRCSQTRWIEIHHHHPIHRGGTNDVKNLATLCSIHHRRVHQESGIYEKPGGTTPRFL